MSNQTTCSYCGAHYEHEAYRWLVSSFYNVNESTMFKIGDFIKKFFIFCGALFAIGLLLSIFLFVTGNSEGVSDSSPIVNTVRFMSNAAFSGSLILLLGGVVVYLIYGLFAFVGPLFAAPVELARIFRFVKLRRRDKNFSTAKMRLLGSYLLSTNPEILGDLDPHDDEAVISEGIIQQHIGKYTQADGYEFIRVGICHLEKHFSLDASGKAQIKLKQRKLNLPLRRADQVLTPIQYEPSQYTCEACGSHEPIIQSEMQECTYCGNQKPYDQIDWVLEREKL